MKAFDNDWRYTMKHSECYYQVTAVNSTPLDIPQELSGWVAKYCKVFNTKYRGLDILPRASRLNVYFDYVHNHYVIQYGVQRVLERSAPWCPVTRAL